MYRKIKNVLKFHEYKYAKQYSANYLSEISDDSNAWKLMAEIAELNDNNWQKAIDCYTKGIQYDPANPILPANRAMALLKTGQIAAAEADCTLAIRFERQPRQCLL